MEEIRGGDTTSHQLYLYTTASDSIYKELYLILFIKSYIWLYL